MRAYRPDIDGLRAIAVISVLLFHANFNFMKAGFIGVDIFFVISGYLITLGIKNNIEADKFSLKEFFNRRLWRIQPLMISLMLVTLVMQLLYAIPPDFLKYTESLKSLSLFISNQYFATLDAGYFAEDTSIMPLLHTWTLSIEWQWYLALPFTMFLIKRPIKAGFMFYIIAPFTIIMMIVGVSSGLDNANSHYYSFISRIFEFSAGSCIAAINSNLANKINTKIQLIISFCSLGLIAHISTIENTLLLYPNKSTVIVTICSAWLIFIGASENKDIITRFLSLKPFVFIGLISYSIYVWHWPLFAITRYLAISETVLVKLMLLILSVLLAYISYRFVESPLRKKHSVVPLPASILILFIIPAVAACVLHSYTVKTDGLPQRNPALFNSYRSKTASVTDWRAANKGCFLTAVPGEIMQTSDDNCSSGATLSDRKAILMGDSWAGSMNNFFHVLGEDADVKIITRASASCVPLLNTYQQWVNDEKHVTNCIDIKKHSFNQMKKGEYEYVILTAAWLRFTVPSSNALTIDNYTGDSKDILSNALYSTVESILNAGATPILVISVFDPIHVKLKKDMSKCALIRNCDFDDIKVDADIWLEKTFNDIKSMYPQTIIINVRELQCPEDTGVCKTIIDDDYPVYSDYSGHITDYASKVFAKEYLEQHGNPFKR